jgi:hypothetical protein
MYLDEGAKACEASRFTEPGDQDCAFFDHGPPQATTHAHPDKAKLFDSQKKLELKKGMASKIFNRFLEGLWL